MFHSCKIPANIQIPENIGLDALLNYLIERIKPEVSGIRIFHKKTGNLAGSYLYFFLIPFSSKSPFHHPVAKNFHDVIYALFEVNFAVIACCQWHFQTFNGCSYTYCCQCEVINFKNIFSHAFN